MRATMQWRRSATWQPSVLGWRIAALFMIGSLLFALGSFPAYAQLVDPGAVGVTFVLGSLFFNFNTIDAMFANLSVNQVNRLVWAPDFFGSIAFLVASHLAWVVVCGRLWCVRRDSADWWVSALNYLGSVFFMMAAVAAFTLPTTGETLNLTVVNSCTFLGAVCFFVGAYLLLPAREKA